MKKKTLFGLLTPLIALSFTACGAPKYEYNICTQCMRFENQIKGKLIFHR